MPYLHSKHLKEPIWVPDPPKPKRGRKPVPVVETDVDHMWDYEYQAKNPMGRNTILASNSLTRLKEEIKVRRWKYASISCTHGMFSVGQSAVHEYPYEPRYK